jgi:hypothetical protein
MVSLQEASRTLSVAGKNKMKFVNVNGRILDYSCYKEEVKLMNKIMAADVKSYLEKLGFLAVNKKCSSYNNFKIIFYNPPLDLEITVAANKKNAEVFL